jgi:lipoprotein-releasing system permease protein
VTVGVAALVIALALMTGLQEEVRDRILGSNPHMFVWNQEGIADYRVEADRLKGLSDVIGAAPGILDRGLVSSPSGQAFIQIKGIDPAIEPSVTDIGAAIRAGSLDSLAADSDDLGAILIGRDLASQLGVSVGDPIQILTTQGTLTPMGMMPRLRRLHVGGIFSLGLYEFDSQWGFVSLDAARRLSGKDRVDFIQLRVRDMWQAPRIAAEIPRVLGPHYIVQDWSEMNRPLFSALTLEKMAIGLTIGLIVVVAALNIVASLILLVMEKHRDIAILKTMGASARSVTMIFMAQGLIIGVIGTSVGAGLGTLIAAIADKYRLIRIPMDVYQVSHVPFRVLPLNFALVVLAAIAVCFVATIYPSRQAARLDPAQGLRYE